MIDPAARADSRSLDQYRVCYGHSVPAPGGRQCCRGRAPVLLKGLSRTVGPGSRLSEALGPVQ
eukprot:683125-Hanusia_phi.AAC.1